MTTLSSLSSDQEGLEKEEEAFPCHTLYIKGEFK
jgi:hypothetical protein